MNFRQDAADNLTPEEEAPPVCPGMPGFRHKGASIRSWSPAGDRIAFGHRESVRTAQAPTSER